MSLGCVYGRTFFLNSSKYDQIWDIKEKRFCIFAHFELLTKSFWCPEQERFDYFLLNPTIYSCVPCNYLCIQITQQNPAKRQKGGQKVAKGSESNKILIM